jgi:hypothetical protein
MDRAGNDKIEWRECRGIQQGAFTILLTEIMEEGERVFKQKDRQQGDLISLSF